MATDLIVYGAQCSWFGKLEQAGSLFVPGSIHGLPCCPYCKGVLMQTEKSKWDEGAKRHAAKPGNEGYLEFLEWLAKKTQCWSSLTQARKYFDMEKKIIDAEKKIHGH